ncbi:MAG: hypothetical protein N838_17545 [Thiohalocapsa sp. PB-PSB1]|jgi:hypothetical protein|nr:MAG: hypothetical protein N838_17545 [Thiohalocapsa sp. PB-PSB1]
MERGALTLAVTSLLPQDIRAESSLLGIDTDSNGRPAGQ